MKKIINDPENYVDEVLEGILLAYGDKLTTLEGDSRIILSKNSKKERVGIVTGGGSGHLPFFLGYVGDGLADGCAVGNVFASPSSQKMFSLIKACNTGKGVLCLYGNYGGDRMNFDLACEQAESNGIKTITVPVSDDIASSPKKNAEKRRGIAGMVYAYKCAGAAASAGASLEEVAAVAKKAVANTRSMGIALSPCIVPQVGQPTFLIADDEMEIGMGIHGEPGIEVTKLMSADKIAGVIYSKICLDMPLQKGDSVSVMINGLGATPLEELFIIYRTIHKKLLEDGIAVYMPHVGEFATSMEMAGLSVSIFKLDARLKELLQAPASSPFYTNHNK